MCYEAGLVSGHAPDAAQFLSIAVETFIKEGLSSIFSRTRCNGPGDSGNAGFGPGGAWVQTHKYRKQLAKEEEAFQRGEISRDKSGLLPVEARAASERGPLGMADMRIALEMGDGSVGGFPVIARSIIYGYREGELENRSDYTWLPGAERTDELDVEMTGIANGTKHSLPNGVYTADQMDIDNEIFWEGADPRDGDFLDNVLDSCLAVG